MQTHSCSASNLPCFWISASNICTSWCWLVESAICAFKLLFDWGPGTCYLNQTWWPSCSFIKYRISLHREKCAKLGFVCLFGKVIIFGIKTQKWWTTPNHAVHTKSDQLACECQSSMNVEYKPFKIDSTTKQPILFPLLIRSLWWLTLPGKSSLWTESITEFREGGNKGWKEKIREVIRRANWQSVKLLQIPNDWAVRQERHVLFTNMSNDFQDLKKNN